MENKNLKFKISSQGGALSELMSKSTSPGRAFSERILKMTEQSAKFNNSISKFVNPGGALSELTLKLTWQSSKFNDSILTINKNDFHQKLQKMTEASKYSISQNLLSKEIIYI